MSDNLLAYVNKDTVEATFYTMDEILKRLKISWESLQYKKRIEIILSLILKNNYTLTDDLILQINEDFGEYENSWGRLLKTIVSYPDKCKGILQLCKVKGYLSIKEKNVNLKVKIKKIEKLSNDLIWGFKTVRRKNPKGTFIDFFGTKVFKDSSIPRNTVYIGLEDLGNDESLFGIFDIECNEQHKETVNV